MPIRLTTRPSMARRVTPPPPLTASATCTSVDHPHPSGVTQPGDSRLHWLPIAVDGTIHQASYVHCTLGGTAGPNQRSSWWLLGGSEKWQTLHAASQEMDFDDELRKALAIRFKDTEGNDRPSLFSVCRWESAGAHGGLPKVEGVIPQSHGVLGLHAQPCPLPCYLWPSKCNRRRLDTGCCYRRFT